MSACRAARTHACTRASVPEKGLIGICADMQVRTQDGVFESIKVDVEALLMQAPSVNFDNLGAQLASLETCLPEQVVPCVSPSLSLSLLSLCVCVCVSVSVSLTLPILWVYVSVSTCVCE
jgi:hypothetical protein